MRKRIAGSVALSTMLTLVAAAQDPKTVIGESTKAMGADSLNVHHFLGIGVERQFRPDQEHQRPLRAVDDHHELYAHHRFGAAGVARHGHDDDACTAGGATAAAGEPQPDHRAECALGAAAGDLDHALGLPEGRRGQQRDGALSERSRARRTTSCRGARRSRRRAAAYTVIGYINDKNMVERVETWVEHPILGDLHVEAFYSDYQDFGGLKVPAKIVQKRVGMETFVATIATAPRIRPTSRRC